MFSRVSGTNKKYAQYGSLSHRRSFLASFLFDILIYGIIASNKMFEAQLVEKAKWKKNVHKKSRCESPA